MLLGEVPTRSEPCHHSIRTEEAYARWIKEYIFFHNMRHAEMSERVVSDLLSHLAAKRRVAASTQKAPLQRHLAKVTAVHERA
jgi:hypothetical protein